MATSSIFENVKITDSKKAEIFIEALESSKIAQDKKLSVPVIPIMRNEDDIHKLMA